MKLLVTVLECSTDHSYDTIYICFNIHRYRELAKDTERSVGYAFNKVATVNQFGAAALIARQMFLLCSMQVASTCDFAREDFHEESRPGLDSRSLKSPSKVSCVLVKVVPTYGPFLFFSFFILLAFKVRMPLPDGNAIRISQCRCNCPCVKIVCAGFYWIPAA